MTENQENSNNDLMEHPPHSESNKNSTSQKNTHDHKSPDYVDIILSRKGTKVVDLETLVKETQKRLWAALKQGYEYESTIIIRSFAQEMSSIIMQHDGYVLKFVGDAVIGYFVAEAMPLLATDNAVNCAKAMVTVVERRFNRILFPYDYRWLPIKRRMYFGQNIIVRY